MTMVRTCEAARASFKCTEPPAPHIFVSKVLSPNSTSSWLWRTSEGVLASRAP